MYAITSVSSSAIEIAKVTNEIKAQLPSFSNRSPDNGYAKETTQAVPTPAPINTAINVADKVEATKPSYKSVEPNRQLLSKPQMRKVANFNLSLVENSEQNISNRDKVEHVAHKNKMGKAQHPTNNKILETPYMIVVVNQTLSHLQQNNASSKKPESEGSKPDKIQN